MTADVNAEPNARPNPYDPAAIEPKWQRRWEEQGTFRAKGPGDPGFDPAQPKFYVLDMFPYPSGSGLHVGHAVGYIGTDIVARRKRMEGCNVLHPMGWDAFGLPAEQYAVKTGVHPAITTAENIVTFKRQMKPSLRSAKAFTRSRLSINPAIRGSEVGCLNLPILSSARCMVSARLLAEVLHIFIAASQSQGFGLRQPVVACDSAFEVQEAINPLDFRISPISNLVEMEEAQIM